MNKYWEITISHFYIHYNMLRVIFVANIIFGDVKTETRVWAIEHEHDLKAIGKMWNA